MNVPTRKWAHQPDSYLRGLHFHKRLTLTLKTVSVSALTSREVSENPPVE